ncbi:MAG: sugar ABC transporter ATP-binding protein [Bradyrhizobium sp.]|nr:sugar ABC transporter ATP-binding protein [Bradyrhizobium sp.]
MQPTSNTPQPVLQMRDISKTFPGVRALSGVGLSVYAGEIHALVGENGAGKSTLMKVLAGAYQADPGGKISIDGQPVVLDGPAAARRHGIAVIYQELSLSPNLTVAENIYLGREMHRRSVLCRKRMAGGCRDLLDRLGATFGPNAVVGSLSIAERQLLEIIRALHSDARILVMDEPTTALSTAETDRLFELIRGLKAEGLAIIYISHRMAEIYELADRISVLRDGAYVGSLQRVDLTPDVLVKMMVGRDIAGFYKKDHKVLAGRDRIILSVRDFSDGKRIHNCGFDLHEGEVLGLAGLVGSGRTELARLIFGADSRMRGTLELDGRAISITTPSEALNSGIVYLTEDRKGQGLFLDMSVEANVNTIICSRDAGTWGILNLLKARKRARDAVSGLTIRVPHIDINVGALSGGNQQKVLLSRLLEIKPKVLILDEPTRGVDIGAKSEIYRVIDQLVEGGTGVIMISSELPEIVGTCDRVLVMHAGSVQGEVGGLHGAAVTQENIMSLATGLNLVAA